MICDCCCTEIDVRTVEEIDCDLCTVCHEAFCEFVDLMKDMPQGFAGGVRAWVADRWSVHPTDEYAGIGRPCGMTKGEAEVKDDPRLPWVILQEAAAAWCHEERERFVRNGLPAPEQWSLAFEFLIRKVAELLAAEKLWQSAGRVDSERLAKVEAQIGSIDKYVIEMEAGFKRELEAVQSRVRAGFLADHDRILALDSRMAKAEGQIGSIISWMKKVDGQIEQADIRILTDHERLLQLEAWRQRAGARPERRSGVRDAGPANVPEEPLCRICGQPSYHRLHIPGQGKTHEFEPKPAMSLEQVCRDVLERAVDEGLVSTDTGHKTHPQGLSAGDLVGVANLLNARIGEMR